MLHIAKARQIILARIAYPHHSSDILYNLCRSDGCFSYIEVVEHPLALLTTIMALMYTCAVVAQLSVRNFHLRLQLLLNLHIIIRPKQ